MFPYKSLAEKSLAETRELEGVESLSRLKCKSLTAKGLVSGFR